MTVVIYLLREIIPQFVMWLLILSGVLVISQIVRLADSILALGVSLENVTLPLLFVVLPFMNITIPMAYLFAVLVGIGRLSVDGELTALLSAGYSLARTAIPVVGLGAVLYAVAAWCALVTEPWGRRELKRFYYEKAQSQLDHMIRFQLQGGVFLEDFLGFVLYAERVNSQRSTLENVLLAPAERSATGGNYTVMAPAGAFSGSVESGRLTLDLNFGTALSHNPETGETTVLKFRRAEIDLLKMFQDQIFGGELVVDDYRNLPPSKLLDHIAQLRSQPESADELLRAETLFHQRAGLPGAIFAFALFGLVLGISDPRQGKSKVFYAGVACIMATYVLGMAFRWLGDNRFLAPMSAAWLPSFLLCCVGLYWLYQRNRLPPSENPFAPEYFPYFGAFERARRVRHKIVWPDE